MFTGWYTSKRLVQEIKVRVHWFDFLHASVGSEYARCYRAKCCYRCDWWCS